MLRPADVKVQCFWHFLCICCGALCNVQVWRLVCQLGESVGCRFISQYAAAAQEMFSVDTVYV